MKKPTEGSVGERGEIAIFYIVKDSYFTLPWQGVRLLLFSYISYRSFAATIRKAPQDLWRILGCPWANVISYSRPPVCLGV